MLSSPLNADEDGLSAVPRGSRHKLEELKTLVLSVLHRYNTLAARTNAERWRVGDLFDERIQLGQSDTVLDALVRHYESQIIAMEYRCETAEKLVEQERVRCRSMEQRAQVAEQERGQLLEHSERQQQDVQRMVTALEKQVRERAARQRTELESAHRHLSITQASLREAEETKSAILEELKAEAGLRQRAEATYELGQKAAASQTFQLQTAQDELNGARLVIYQLESCLRIEQENHRYQVAQQQLERGTNDLESSIFRKELSRLEHEALALAEQKQRAKEDEETAGLEHDMLFLSASRDFGAHPEAMVRMQGEANMRRIFGEEAHGSVRSRQGEMDARSTSCLEKQSGMAERRSDVLTCRVDSFGAVKRGQGETDHVLTVRSKCSLPSHASMTGGQCELDARHACAAQADQGAQKSPEEMELYRTRDAETQVGLVGLEDVMGQMGVRHACAGESYGGMVERHEEVDSCRTCNIDSCAAMVERQGEADARRSCGVETHASLAEVEGRTCNMDACAAFGTRQRENAPSVRTVGTQGDLSEEQDKEDVRRVCVGERLKNMEKREKPVAINGCGDVQTHEGASRGHEELKASSVCRMGLLAQVVVRQKETEVLRPSAVEALEDIAQGQENLYAGFTCNVEAKAAGGQRKAETMQMMTDWDDRELGGFSEPGSITCSPIRQMKFVDISADETTQEASVSQAATQGDTSDTKPATPMGVEAGTSADADGMDACRGRDDSAAVTSRFDEVSTLFAQQRSEDTSKTLRASLAAADTAHTKCAPPGSITKSTGAKNHYYSPVHALPHEAAASPMGAGAHPNSVAPVFRPFGSMGPDMNGQPLLRKPRSRTDVGRSGISTSEPLAPASRTAASVSTTEPQATARQCSAQKGSQPRSGSMKKTAKLEVRTLTRSVERPHQKSTRKRRLFSTADCKLALGGSPLKQLDLFAD